MQELNYFFAGEQRFMKKNKLLQLRLDARKVTQVLHTSSTLEQYVHCLDNFRHANQCNEHQSGCNRSKNSKVAKKHQVLSEWNMLKIKLKCLKLRISQLVNSIIPRTAHKRYYVPIVFCSVT